MDLTRLENLFDYKAICEAIFNHSIEAIVIVDEQGRIKHANPCSLSLFGYTIDELVDKRVEILVPNQFKKDHHHQVSSYNKNPHARAMAGGIGLYGQKKDGSVFPMSASLSPALIEGQKFTIVLVIDSTEIQDSKDKLKKLNQDLEQKVADRTKELAQMVNKLEKAYAKRQKAEEDAKEALKKEKELNELKSRFVSMASHEFRTPLSTILSSVNLLEKYGNDSKYDEKRVKHFERITSNVRNLTSILNDFLSLDKLQEGKIECYKEAFNIKDLFTTIVEEQNDQLKNGQSMAFTFFGEQNVHLDKHLIKNIALNLLSNAIKYSDEDKEIKLDVDVLEKKVIIKIRDQGIGIPEDDKQHMFERFFRAKNATNIQGTGLGLTIVKRYLDLMNGTIDFESEYMEGTTFIIKIPISSQSIEK